MEDIRKLDPSYTDWVPKTATEAIQLFYKKKGLGQIKWDDVDITFRELARGLDQEQFNIFVQWITNPSCVQVGTEPDCFPKSGFFERENSTHTTQNPPSHSQDDEKCPA
jgi:hypothetical protein